MGTKNSKKSQTPTSSENDISLMAINPDGVGFAHIVEHGPDSADHPWTKITYNSEGVITKGEIATAEDIPMASDDPTTVKEKFDMINKIVPTEEMTANRMLITDDTGKVIPSSITTAQMNAMLFFEDAYVSLPDLPS